MDEWAAANPAVPVYVQIGSGRYEPVHAQFVRMMPPTEFRRRVAEARLFVAHAGVGSILSAIQAGKPMLMLPRLQAEGEHNTDHQVATAKDIGARPGLHVARDAADLKARVSALLADAGAPPAPISPVADPGADRPHPRLHRGLSLGPRQPGRDRRPAPLHARGGAAPRRRQPGQPVPVRRRRDRGGHRRRRTRHRPRRQSGRRRNSCRTRGPATGSISTSRCRSPGGMSPARRG